MTVLSCPSVDLKPDRAWSADHADAASKGPSPDTAAAGRTDPRGVWWLRPRLRKFGFRCLTMAVIAAVVCKIVSLEIARWSGADGRAAASTRVRYNPCEGYQEYALLDNEPPPGAVPKRIEDVTDMYDELLALGVTDASVLDGPFEYGAAVTAFIPASDHPEDPARLGGPVLIGEKSRFIHDFSANVTAIVDNVGRRCFVMPLVRDPVVTPSSLYDMLFKMTSGYYAKDNVKMLDNMRIVMPALEDLSDYGLYISHDCACYCTYRLEKVARVPPANA